MSLAFNGDSENRIDFVLLGDGYTTAELSKFETDAASFRQGMFAQEPFLEYQSYFNVWRVDVASTESGSDHPEQDPALVKDTAFDSTYNCAGIPRLICIDQSKVLAAVGDVPLVQRDFLIVIVNDSEYGGSGGAIAVASTDSLAIELVLHELGHSVASLADEYTATPPPCVSDTEPFEANATRATDRASIKWNNWIDASVEIPTQSTTNGVPGLYLGAKYCEDGLYRPTFDSKMRSLGRPYEQVNIEQFVRTFYSSVSPIDSVQPTSTTISIMAGQRPTFSVTTQQPATHGLDVSWMVDGSASGSGSSFVFDSAGSVGEHTVTVVVIDSTSMVRNDPDMLLRDQRSWVITVEPVTSPLFSVPERGGVSLRTSGDSGAAQVGYARIEPDVGALTPSGVAIFGFTQAGVLVTEAAVPASVTTQAGRIFAEIEGTVTTGIAMANPNDESATVSFTLRDQDGIETGSGSFTIGANAQIAKFLDQEPFNAQVPIKGTFTYTASIPVSVVALRGLTNERSEFLITTLPVAPLSSNTDDEVYLPHFADGSGWTTQIVLVNPTDEAIGGTVRFFGQGSGSAAASPVTLLLDDGRSGSEFSYSIAPRSSRRLRTGNPAGVLNVGSLRVAADTGTSSPTALGIFSFESGGVTVSEAGVPSLPAGSGFRIYVESDGTPGQVGSIRTGVAVANTGSTEESLVLELNDQQGNPVGPAATLQVPPSGQAARFVDELFSGLSAPFSGVLRITSAGSPVAVVGLRGRTNERGDFLITTTPPTNESATPAALSFFPHIAEAGGWRTQFILFGGTAGQSSSGLLRFFTQSGETWLLNPAVIP